MMVSVIIPNHNRIEELETAIKSIKRQTYCDYEIIVVGENDMEIRGCRCFNVGDVGMANKINFGAKKANGELLLVLGDDDFLDKDYLDKTTRFMPAYDIVYTDMQRFGDVDYREPAREWNEENFKISTVPFITSLVKKSLFEKVGGYQKGDFFQDWDFWWRCYEAGAKAYWLPEPLFFYRTHKGQDTNLLNLSLFRENTIKKHAKKA